MKSLVALSFIFVLISGCAHHRDVRAGANGIHKVVVQAEDKKAGARDAIKQASHFCEERNQSAAFIKEKQEYTGDIDEKSYKRGKRAAKVAKTVGGAVSVMGGQRESNIGGIVGLGGVAGDAALGDGYTVEMRFKCI